MNRCDARLSTGRRKNQACGREARNYDSVHKHFLCGKHAEHNRYAHPLGALEAYRAQFDEVRVARSFSPAVPA